MALVMIAAWGAWCRRQGYQIKVRNQGPHAAYMARMRLFEHLGVPYDARPATAREEAGRFLPVTQVTRREDVPGVIGSISALLHLQDDPEALSAVQYCVSELLRNVLEHSGSPDGGFVAAHRYTKKGPHRVTIAVADCGRGIADHLGQVHPEALQNDRVALALAMRPGITGARAGMYGVPDNAGAGLFITRCMAKGTGGYFLLSSGRAAYRLRRSRGDEEMLHSRFGRDTHGKDRRLRRILQMDLRSSSTARTAPREDHVHMTTVIVVKPGANRFAEDKEQARELRLQQIMPAIECREKVLLDFKDVSYATQSYVHALIGEPLQKHGELALDYLEFRNCSPALRSVIELVVDYTLGGFPEHQTS